MSHQELIFVLMCQRKAWTKEEDDLLREIMQQEESFQNPRKLRWNDIAAKISSLGSMTPRKGKQCRQRWFNQLHPSIVKEQDWLPSQETTLFSLQAKFGNHWAKISKGLPGRSDNAIKNYFYSCLRKALRKVNNYIYNNKRLAKYKNIKPFQKTTLSKILSVAQNKAENKISIAKEEAPLIARAIKTLLIDIQIFRKDQEPEEMSDTMADVVSKIQEFNRICKRKKTKKKSSSKYEQAQRPTLVYSKEKSEEDPSSFSEEEGSSSENGDELQQRRQLLIQPVQKSQGVKLENEVASHKFSTSDSMDEVKKMKKEVVIPVCQYNCQKSSGNPHISQVQGRSLHQPGTGNTQASAINHPVNRPFMPYLPIYPTQYYAGNPYAPSFFRNDLQSALHAYHGMGVPLSHSSFNLCREWTELQRTNPFHKEQAIRLGSNQNKEDIKRQ